LQLVGELKDGGWGHAISLIAKHASRAISICIPVQIWPRQIEEAAGKLALIVQTKSATIHLHNKRPARVPFSETVVQNPESSIHYPVSNIQYLKPQDQVQLADYLNSRCGRLMSANRRGSGRISSENKREAFLSISSSADASHFGCGLYLDSDLGLGLWLLEWGFRTKLRIHRTFIHRATSTCVRSAVLSGAVVLECLVEAASLIELVGPVSQAMLPLQTLNEIRGY